MKRIYNSLTHINKKLLNIYVNHPWKLSRMHVSIEAKEHGSVVLSHVGARIVNMSDAYPSLITDAHVSYNRRDL
jgi:hypothetical protein